MIKTPSLWRHLVVLLFLPNTAFSFLCPPLRSLPKSTCPIVSHNSIKYGKRAKRYTITSINMGLRDFIKKKVKQVKSGDDKDEDKSESNAINENTNVARDSDSNVKDETIASEDTTSSGTTLISSSTIPLSLQTSPIFRKFEQRPMRMGEDPRTKEVDVHRLSESESIQERINRVKSGQMTDEEKEAFLQTALTAGNSVEKRKPLVNTSSISRKKPVSASPFPSDSILRNFARGKNASNNLPDISVPKSVLDSQQQKKAYLEMVTDPKRFKNTVRNTDTPTSASQDNTQSTAKDTTSSNSDNSDSRTGDIQDRDTKLAAANPPLPDLGARLGHAALDQELQRQQADATRRRLELEKQQKLQPKVPLNRESEARVREITRLRDEQFRQQEEERLRRRKVDDEATTQRDRERKKQEEEQMRERMKLQEEYWQKKLASEKLALETKQNDEPKQVGRFAKASSRLKRSINMSTWTQQARNTQKPFNPDETNKLKEAKDEHNNDWNQNQKIIANSAARESLRVGSQLSDIPRIESEEEFIEFQRKKQSELERIRAEQMERLKNLNSPLPRPKNKDVDSAQTPALQENRKVQISQKPIQISSVIARQKSGQESAKNTADFSKENETEMNEPDDEESTVGGLFGGKGVNFRIGSNSSQDTPETKNAEKNSLPVVHSERNDRINKDENNNTNKEASVPAPVKKGPIRMQLPLSNDKDEEEGVDVRTNKAMSVAEAMRRTIGEKDNNVDQEERAKKWGIDMSKFSK